MKKISLTSEWFNRVDEILEDLESDLATREIGTTHIFHRIQAEFAYRANELSCMLGVMAPDDRARALSFLRRKAAIYPTWGNQETLRKGDES